MKQFSFDKLVGNTYTISLLERSLVGSTFKPFTIFSGVMGTGKSTSAKISSLYLTCENPVSGKPCLQCRSCRANMHAFQTTGESSNVKIINAGKLFTQEDVGRIIKDIFSLEHGVSNHVYVFEEVHALKGVKGAQIALLEEIDRMPEKTYVIMCTTKSYDLIPELRSRAVEFEFNRLSRPESEMLLNLYTSETYKKVLPSKVLSLLVSESRGVPRDALKLADFVIENNVTFEEVKEYLHDVSDSTLISIFQSMLQKDAGTYLALTSELLDKRSPYDVLRYLREFFVKCLFCVEAGIQDSFTAEEASDVKEIFNLSNLGTLTQITESLGSNPSADSLMLGFFKMRLALQKRGLSDVCAEKKRVGASEKIATTAIAREVQKTVNEPHVNSFRKVSMDFLNSFGE